MKEFEENFESRENRTRKKWEREGKRETQQEGACLGGCGQCARVQTGATTGRRSKQSAQGKNNGGNGSNRIARI